METSETSTGHVTLMEQTDDGPMVRGQKNADHVEDAVAIGIEWATTPMMYANISIKGVIPLRVRHGNIIQGFTDDGWVTFDTFEV